ncbi:MAG: class I SAM-dependent methyltransferase [Bacteroidales bacterium]|nr:class I SAM-dependent methyltransferase [Bacteroidales bacterium]MBN2761919.1 class I SAM-dependent methyltransferase [Bacteroidales bacterium]
MEHLTDNQLIQEEQYTFPYHYADLISDRHRYFKFIGTLDLIRIVKNKVYSLNKNVILDAGCGDGRLCYELRDEKLTVAGADYSESAIAFARAFNPGLDFFVQDLRSLKLPYKFDLVIMMEVLEHFIPEQIPSILSSLSEILKADGKLLITVPSVNIRMPEKHYQHFTRESLSATLKPYFEIEEITGYARRGTVKKMYSFLKSLGNLFYPFRKDSDLARRYFAFYRQYYEKHVSTGKPDKCDGIMAVCKKAAV